MKISIVCIERISIDSQRKKNTIIEKYKNEMESSRASLNEEKPFKEKQQRLRNE